MSDYVIEHPTAVIISIIALVVPFIYIILFAGRKNIVTDEIDSINNNIVSSVTESEPVPNTEPVMDSNNINNNNNEAKDEVEEVVVADKPKRGRRKREL